MKPAPFGFDAPTTVDEAVRLLAAHGGDATVIAGGQSLVPLLALRSVRSRHLVDLNRIPALAGVRPADDGGLAIGAMTRTRELETSSLVVERAPLAAQAAPFVGSRQIRNRGTVGGSLAHADAAAELPAVALALEATIAVRGPRGDREIAAGEFFGGDGMTALEQDEILVELRVRPAPPRTGTAFLEISRRQGDVATVGVAACVTVDQAGAVAGARLALAGVADRPFDATAATRLRHGRELDVAGAADVGAAAAALVPPCDENAEARAGDAYRRQLVAVLVERALLAAAARA